MRQLDPGDRLYASIDAFLSGVDVVENELLDPGAMPAPFGTVLRDYYATLERYRLLTYGQQVVRAVRELENPPLAAQIHTTLRHLIVDEYQDINPAQERLIELLTGPNVELCVVGDDQQAIYQWRGSDVRNIVKFATRYVNVATFEITTNRRSRPGIIATANTFAESILGRLPKTMLPFRPAGGPEPDVVAWTEDTSTDEAGQIAWLIDRLIEGGTPPKDIAVLVRGRASYAKLTEQFATFGIPVQPGGRTGLFDQPEGRLLGQTMAWLSDVEWREPYQRGVRLTERDILDGYQSVFSLGGTNRKRLQQALRDWKAAVPGTDRNADLVGELYELLDVLDVRDWDLTDVLAVNGLGTLARFSALLADYESVRRRARPDADAEGEQVGGETRGTWYYRNLALHIINYAQGAFEGFDGEDDFALNAIDLTTVHRAKGLEWPAVFVPALTAKRFPSSRTGDVQDWLVPRTMFDAPRYEGSDTDERRLFYVAITRARDWLSVSRHERVTTQRVAQSPYHAELSDHTVDVNTIEFPTIDTTDSGSDASLDITYSELAAFLECGMAYRLRNVIGFQPRLAPELGYGKAVHHVLRSIAETTRSTGKVPSRSEIDAILDSSFFLPTANKVAHRQLKDAARRLITTYATKHEADLHRIWETERPFELHLDGATVTGRADVILDHEGGVPTALALVDYKTSVRGSALDHALQLQVYANAGIREGLDVRAAFVHDLKTAARDPIGITPADISAAEATVTAAAERIKARDYAPNPGPICARCEVRTICRHAKR